MSKIAIRYGIVALCLCLVFIAFLAYKGEQFDFMIFEGVCAILGAYYILYAVIISLLQFILKQNIQLITLALGITLLIAAVQFKIQHWPNSKLLNISGWILIGIFIAVYFRNRNRSK